MTGGRRFALLLALRDSEYAKAAHGGYRNVFVSAFGSPAGEEEQWDSYRLVDGEFPEAEDLPSYDGFVISGSPSDAHGDEPWILRLCDLVRTLHAMRKRVLGVCFGHQLLCRALGGRVARSPTGWDVGVRKVTLAKDIIFQGFLLGNNLDEEEEELVIHHQLQWRKASAHLIEVHQDEVVELPPHARVLAYSDKTRVEAFAVGDHVMGVQGHPEYGLDILHNLVDRLTNDGSISRRAGKDARRSAAETGGPDSAFWTALCRGFLRGGGRRRSSRPMAAAATAATEAMAGSSGRTVAAGCFVEAPMLHQLACSAGIN